MNRKLLSIIASLGLLFPCYGLVTEHTNSVDLTLANVCDGSFNDFNFKVSGYDSQKFKFTYDISLVGLDCVFRITKPIQGTIYLDVPVTDITVATSNITWTISRTNIPPPGNYYGELLSYDAGTTNIYRSLAQGKLPVTWSLYLNETNYFTRYITNATVGYVYVHPNWIFPPWITSNNINTVSNWAENGALISVSNIADGLNSRSSTWNTVTDKADNSALVSVSNRSDIMWTGKVDYINATYTETVAKAATAYPANNPSNFISSYTETDSIATNLIYVTSNAYVAADTVLRNELTNTITVASNHFESAKLNANGSGAGLTGITAAQVGAVGTNDVSVTNARSWNSPNYNTITNPPIIPSTNGLASTNWVIAQGYSTNVGGGAGTLTNILSSDGSVGVTSPGGPQPNLSITNWLAARGYESNSIALHGESNVVIRASGTNYYFGVTNLVSKTDTNGWITTTHSAWITNEALWIANSNLLVSKTDTNGWITTTHSAWITNEALWIANSNLYVPKSNTNGWTTTTHAGLATGTPLYVETYVGTVIGGTITAGASNVVTTNAGVLGFTWNTNAAGGGGAPYQTYTATITPNGGGTCTITYAHGSLVQIYQPATNITLSFTLAGYPTAGVSRVGVQIYSLTNLVALDYTTCTNDNASATNKSTTGWTTWFFRRSGNEIFKERQ